MSYLNMFVAQVENDIRVVHLAGGPSLLRVFMTRRYHVILIVTWRY